MTVDLSVDGFKILVVRLRQIGRGACQGKRVDRNAAQLLFRVSWKGPANCERNNNYDSDC